MKSLKTRLVASVGAAAMILSVPFTASAGGSDLLDLDLGDVNAAILNLTGICTEIITHAPIDVSKVSVVNVEELADVDANDLADIDDTLNNLVVSLQLLNFQNVLNNANFLNGNEIIKGSKVLTDKGVNVSDIIGGDVLSTGDLVLFSCPSCCD